MHRKGSARTGERELTGRTVLLCLIAFFGVIAGVNAIMIRAATSTFGGVETESAYKAGLAYKHEAEAARTQDALKWRVVGGVERNGAGEAILTIDVEDQQGTPLPNLVAAARLVHPMDSRLDHDVALWQWRTGRFQGKADIAPGQWNLVIDIMRGEERVFRSKSRVVLR